MSKKTYRGRTEDAEASFLSAEFWKPGVRVVGVVGRMYESQNGRCYVLHLVTPVEVAGEKQDEVAIGNLTGFRMACQAAGVSDLRVGDQLVVECTAIEAAKKKGMSPRPNFAVEVTREDQPDDGFAPLD
jgi:hypothetical protein